MAELRNGTGRAGRGDEGRSLSECLRDDLGGAVRNLRLAVETIERERRFVATERKLGLPSGFHGSATFLALARFYIAAAREDLVLYG